MPISRIITITGIATLLLAPFGAFALNLSAITAAICLGREAHEDPAKRYMATVSCGLIYCVIGLFGAAVTGMLTAFPRELVVAIAGFALLGSIGGGLALALKDDAHREPALITFLVTLSGLSLWGIGSAFWAWWPARWRFLCNSGGPCASPEPSDTMKILFVADPLEIFKTYKDTTFAMMREAASRGHDILACEPGTCCGNAMAR